MTRLYKGHIKIFWEICQLLASLARSCSRSYFHWDSCKFVKIFYQDPENHLIFFHQNRNFWVLKQDAQVLAKVVKRSSQNLSEIMLNHYSPLLLFYAWKHQKNYRFSDVFRGYRKATLDCNGLSSFKKLAGTFISLSCKNTRKISITQYFLWLESYLLNSCWCKVPDTGVFLRILWNFWEHIFYRTPLVATSVHLQTLHFNIRWSKNEIYQILFYRDFIYLFIF